MVDDRMVDAVLGLFTTHPKTENRIAALKQQAVEMRRTARPGGPAGPKSQRWSVPETRRRGPWQ